LRTGIDCREQLSSLEPPEGRFGYLQDLPDERRGVLDLLETLGRCGAQPHGGEGQLGDFFFE
jgi:hypothetical protein